MELKDIKKIVQLMSDNDLSEFLLEDETSALQIKRGATVVNQVTSAPAAAPAPAAPVLAANEASPPESSAEDDGLVEITSPMVGTFYRSPSPDSDPFVGVGQEISSDSVVCIVEAMKVMNEIQAEVKGTIRKILVDNATPVQFGQPLFLVEPA